MILFVALALASSCLAEDALREVLKSPKATLELYQEFKFGQGLKSSGREDRMRFRLFRKNAEFVASINEEDEATTYGLNFFSAMTSDEKTQYLGLNMTGHQENSLGSYSAPAGFQAPAKKLWTNEGAVTAVKNQGSCGSCWTFGAVGGLETRYMSKSGKLRNFAEQEYLDCVYESKGRNGCNGGWPDDCYTYSKNNGGRLAAQATYTYTAKDSSCRGSSKPDAMIASKIQGYQSVGRSEAANIEALASGSLSVAFEVTNKFQQYQGGIIKDTTCRGRPNHAVTSVGYTASFVLVKNSWGSSWGDSGFVKFARNYDNCGLFKYSSYPKLSSTGKTDTGPSDKATPYRPSEDDKPNPDPKPQPDPDCKDLATNCRPYHCQWDDIAEKYCKKTCNKCDGGDDKECPSGTIRCPDGICRHEHMC